MAAMAETMPSSVEASETVDETMPSEDQVCKRCLPGLVSTLTKTELERSTRLGYHGKTHEISMGHKQNSYVTVITRGYPTSSYNPANKNLITSGRKNQLSYQASPCS